MIEFPQNINRKITQLSSIIGSLPTDYASLSDEHLAQLSTFYVTFKTSLGSCPELYEELHTAGCKPFCEIYAELAQRISDKKNVRKAELLHTLYQQNAYAPYYAYGECGEMEWIYQNIFDTIENRRSDGASETAILDLILDVCVLFEDSEPEYQAYMESALAKWNEERRNGSWHALPVGELAHRLCILTNYNDSLIATEKHFVSESQELVEAFSSDIMEKADASVMILYREALRNTYYFEMVSTKHFAELERKAESMPKGSLSVDLLQAMLAVDRLERELAE